MNYPLKCNGTPKDWEWFHYSIEYNSIHKPYTKSGCVRVDDNSRFIAWYILHYVAVFEMNHDKV